MYLNGRNLEFGLRGDDVRSLHDDLALLGRRVPDGERAEGYFGDGTRAAVVDFQVRHGLGETGAVDDALARLITAGADPLRPRTIRGTIAVSGLGPSPGIRVVAVDKDLRSETVLGEVVSGVDGAYEIAYTVEQFQRAEKGGADLVVRAMRSDDGASAATSPIVFNAGPVETVDLAVPATDDGLSEFDRYLAEIVPVLDGATLLDLTDDEVGFVVGETGIAREHLVALVAAARQEYASTGADGRSGIHLAAFYGWFRKGLPTDPGALFAHTTDELIGALKSAIGERIAPGWLAGQLDRLAETLRLRRLDQALRPAPEGSTATLGDLLATMPVALDGEQQRAVASVVAELRPTDERFATRLGEAGLSREQVTGVEATLRLGDLTLGHAAMVTRLQRIAGPDAGAALRPLADLRPDQWLDLAYDAGTPAGAAGAPLGEAGYARLLRTRVEDMHPTSTLGARLADGSLVPDLPATGDIPAFLGAHADFDIATTDIPAYVAKLAPGSVPDPQKLTDSLLALKRVKAVGATWPEAGVLVNAGIRSPLDLIGKGPVQLREELGDRIDPTRLGALHEQATAGHDLTLATMSTVLSRFGPTPVAALPAPQVDTAPLADRPTLQSLFGDLDTCACGHCRSVLSPAAYFVDLLQFARERPAVLATLLARRPDLVDLDLSCENAEQEIPCIDLALEVLENAAALPLTVAFPAGTDVAAALAAPRLSPAIRAVLARTALDVPEDVRAQREPVQLLDGPTQWTVTDRHRRWALSHQPEALVATKTGVPGERDVSLAGLDAAAVIAELDQGMVPAAVVPRLSEQLLSPEQRQLGAGYQVGVSHSGHRWSVTGVIGLVVRIETGDISRLTLSTLDGTAIAGNRYSPRALQATAATLGQGAAGGLLTELVPFSDRFDVTPLTEDRWQIRHETVQAELTYAPETLTVTALSYQSSAHPEDALAYPDNRNPEAYQRLRDAVHPWTLPFDLPLAETRALLDRSGTARLRLMELLHPGAHLAGGAAGGGYASAGAPEELVREILGLSPAGSDRITTEATEATDPRIWEIWGLHVASGNATVIDASAGDRVTGPPLTVLKRVSVLMQQAGMSHGELLDVLESRYVRGTGPPLSITPLTECRPSKQVLATLTVPVLDRMHRFVRLCRALGWRAHELDLALAALATPAAITVATLTGLAEIQRLTELLGLPLEEVISWRGGLGTPVYHAHTAAGEPEITPLYDRLFARLSVRNPPDTDFALNSDRTELARTAAAVAANQPVPTMTGKLPALAAAFGVRERDLAGLLGDLLANGTGTPDELRLAHLSTLHAAVSLTTALDLPVDDFLGVQRLTGLQPLADNGAALRFCAAVGSIRDSGCTVGELCYLLRHEGRPGLPAAMSTARATAVLTGLRTALRAVQDELLDRGLAPPAALRTCLTRLEWDPALADDLIALLGGTADTLLPDDPDLLAAITIPASLAHLVSVSGRKLATLDVLPAAGWDRAGAASLYGAVDSGLQVYADWKDAVDRLSTGVAAATVLLIQRLQTAELFTADDAIALAKSNVNADGRRRAVLHRAVRLIQRRAVAAPLAQALGIDAGIVDDLLVERLSAIGDDTTAAIEVFVAARFIGADRSLPPDPDSCPDAFALLRRLHKAALLVDRLAITRPQLGWLAARRGADGMVALDLDTLPTAADDTLPITAGPALDTSGLFAGWQRLVALYRLRHWAPGTADLLTRYTYRLATGNRAEPARTSDNCRQEVADGLGVPETLVSDAAGRIMDRHSPGDLRDPVKLTWLLDLVRALRTLGASTAQAALLTAAEPGLPAAAAARDLLRCRYGPANWREVLASVSDGLRQRQRDALVAYLTGRLVVNGKPLRDAEDLYEHYLIDVLMGPCLTTTRLLQGISAVQLLVHRCLLHLEPTAPPTAIDRPRWEWMKNYRVWEANRKVFLYPQNWLMPELLDNKTENLRELEGGLGAGELSTETAANALLSYLDRLTELSQITVLGMYQHTPVPDLEEAGRRQPPVLYVVGRSPNQPHRYFWRACEDFGTDGMQWTGWERVDAEIAGVHVIPFVFAGDLHIAWPVTRKVEVNGAPMGWDVQLAWVRRTTQGWSQKKAGRDILHADFVAGKDEEATLAFRVQPLQRPPLVTGGVDSADNHLAEEIIIHCYAAASQPPERDPDAVHLFGSKAPVQAFAGFNDLLEIDCRVVLDTTPDREQQKCYELVVGARVRLERRPIGSTGPAVLVADLAATDVYGMSRKAFTRGDLAGETGDPLQYEFVLSVTRDGDQQHAVVILLSEPPPWPVDPSKRTPLATLWQPELVFKAKPSPPAPELYGVGRFVLTSSRDIALDPGASPEFTSVPGATVYGNGYREQPQRPGLDELTLGRQPASITLRSTPGRFLVVPAGPVAEVWNDADTWHYEDDLSSLFLRLPPFAATTLTQAGGDWASDGHGHDYLPPAGNGDQGWLAISDGQPYAGRFRSIAGTGVARLFSPDLQALTDNGQTLTGRNGPRTAPSPASCAEQGVSFDRRAAYGLYNWELFLHAPLLIANQLSQQQRFDEARQWLHLIFDPTTDEPGSTAFRYWRCLPLRAAARGEPIQQLIDWLADPDVVSPAKAAFRTQVQAWKKNPFRPHAVARTRPAAYQWQVLFSYLDNLLDGGDQLFRRDTREAQDEAVLRYVMAAKLLGPRPRPTGSRQPPRTLTYRAVAGQWDDFSNTWLTLSDQAMADRQRQSGVVGDSPPHSGATATLTSLGLSYFCVPHNDKLLAYWDRLEDRLFKVRHCQNIDGVTRNLPLFDPPIDPALLVRAVADGVDLSDALAGRSTPLPHYRFAVLVQKANELCAELKSLGAAVLSALEKKDAERLSQLRSGQEIELLQLVTEVRQHQFDEADATAKALRESRHAVAERYRHYQYLLGRGDIPAPAEGKRGTEEPSTLQFAPATSGDVNANDIIAGLPAVPVKVTFGLGADEKGLGLVQSEQSQLERLAEARFFNLISGLASHLASVSFIAGAYPPNRVWSEPLGHSLNSVGGVFKTLSDLSSNWATRDALLAGHQRRKDDWVFQSNSALRELSQIDQQITAADLRTAIAKREMDNHQKQIDNALAVDAFMREKYTNEQLYTWMTGQLSSVFFATYQVALDTARRAERALAFELGLRESHYLRPGYWDTLKSGLLAGERLSHDLKRMELAYLEHNQREYELTKHISVRQLDPMALIRLKETGTCEISLPETLFDLDCPAYLRRIKTVGLSIPCVTGPYTSVNCRLTLLTSKVRHSNTLRMGKYRRDDAVDDPDDRFTDDHGLIQSMVTSTATNDSGLFETNLRDERYLWFEGAGAISTWRLELPSEFRQFNHDTIADVILHLRYTARDGGEQLRTAALANLNDEFEDAKSQPLARMVSLRHEYPSEWARLTASAAGPRTETVRIGKETFPYLFQDQRHDVTIVKVDVLGVVTDGRPGTLPGITPPGQAGPLELNVDQAETIGDLLHGLAEPEGGIAVAGPNSTWTFAGAEELAALRDVLIVLTYKVR